MALDLSHQIRQQALQLLASSDEDFAGDATKSQARKVVLSRLVQLRAANRTLWQASKAAKATTADAKTGVDKLNLDLQGLYYEQRHLRNEIRSCQETPTVYDQIDLIGEEEFFTLFPESRQLDASQLMQARLNHEMEERLRLESVKKELLDRKSALILENKKRKNELETLEKQLTRFVSSAGDISKMFDKY